MKRDGGFSDNCGVQMNATLNVQLFNGSTFDVQIRTH